jgi:flagellar assembly factor FliW
VLGALFDYTPTATVSDLDAPAPALTEFKLSRAARSIKDAQDLIHALHDNLCWTENAVRRASVQSDISALRLLQTCRSLTQLLAGAVAIARREACLVVPKLRVTLLTDLAGTISNHLKSSAKAAEVAVSAPESHGVAILHDPEITLRVLDRILEVPWGVPADTSRLTVQTGIRGVHAAIVIRCDPLRATTVDSGTLDLPPTDAEEPPSGKSLEEQLAICGAALAHQGAALDYEVIGCGGFELAIIWPLRTDAAILDSSPKRHGTHVACDRPEISDLVGADVDTKNKWSGTMAIQSDRFGRIEAEANDIISFPKGIIGFSAEQQFVLVRTTDASAVGWMQSVSNPSMALPVVSAHVFAPHYPDVDLERYTEAAGLGNSLQDLAVLVVLNAQPGVPATVNLVAPIIVNAATRIGAQVMLEGSRFTTRELFILPSKSDTAVHIVDSSSLGATG